MFRCGNGDTYDVQDIMRQHAKDRHMFITVNYWVGILVRTFGDFFGGGLGSGGIE